MERRAFLGSVGAGVAASRVFGLERLVGLAGEPRVRFGVIADLHHGFAPDALSRLEAFVAAVRARDEQDFVIQLGDFCYAKDSSAECVAAYDRIELPRHHVLGNHDMDVGSKQDVMGAWGMKERHDSFDVGGVHFVVLDLNTLNVDGERVPYDDSIFYVDASLRAWADEDQLAWLKDDLEKTTRPTVVFSHQPLGIGDEALPAQQVEVLDVLRASREHGPGVAACLSGHLHVDRHEVVDGMACVSVNSASYFWRGGMRPYVDPLFAFVTIETGVMS
ncbi:MAG: metallophosphoesterase family protein, partial [Phycisphaerales bacterium]